MTLLVILFASLFITPVKASETVGFGDDVLEPFVDDSNDLDDSVRRPQYQHEGCYNLGKGGSGVLLGDLKNSRNPVKKCAFLAKTSGFTEFALLKGGECRGGDNFQDAYTKSGTSVNCRGGVGSSDSVDVYSIVKVSCRIESSDKASRNCLKQRQEETKKTRIYYELGPPTNTFPLPSLNKTKTVVYGMLKKDPLDNEWVDLYINSAIKKNLKIFQLFYNATNGQEFETEGDYVRALNFFIARQRSMVSNPDDRKYFRFHFEDPSIPFRNLSDLAHWKDNEVFTDQRLAGANPMSIVRASWNPVVSGGVDWAELSKDLNPKFDWEGAVQDAMGSDIALDQAVAQGYVYIVHYPLYKGLTSVATDPFGKLINASSPVAIFVSKPYRQKRPNRLRPVAIQLNCSSDSPVFTPEDGEHWLLAKHVLQVADYAQFQIVEHLYKLHLFMEPLCVCMHRHLSRLHPIHQLLKHHCRGLVGTNKFGYPFLMMPVNGSIDKLLSVGLYGAVKLMLRAHEATTWDDTDFPMNIKKRGLNDREKLPYFPYRDDGELIHEAISHMVNEYVDKYYKTHKEVKADIELQSFVNDASAKGKNKLNGGTGQVKNFPAKITSKWVLKRLLTRFVWVTSAQHSAVNYGSGFIAALTPSMPTKLYDDSRVGRGHYRVYNLPRRYTTGAQAALSMTLASMHYDSLLEYAMNLPDKEGSDVVQKYYSYLHHYVKSTIDHRNIERVNAGYLPYPFFVPGWIANSIHT